MQAGHQDQATEGQMESGLPEQGLGRTNAFALSSWVLVLDIPAILLYNGIKVLWKSKYSLNKSFQS
jgi:hypothetical protein